MRRVSTWAAVTFSCLLVVACNALTGAGDFEVDLVNADAGVLESGTLVDATGSSKDGSTGPSDAQPATDAPNDGPTSLTCVGVGGACVPAAPNGWNGPFTVFDSTKGAIPACPIGLPNVIDVGLGTPSSSYTCGPCKCGGVNGAACTATLHEFSDVACGAASETGAEDTKMCLVNQTGIDGGGKIHVEVTTAGTCNPFVQGTPTVGAITWTSTRRLCGSEQLSAVGCTSPADRCLPPAPNAARCISADGDQACPAPWTQKASTFANTDDTRSCDGDTCSCIAPTGVTCSGTYRLWANATCSAINPPTTLKVDTCFTVPAGNSVKGSSIITASGGSCAPDGAPHVIGALTATAPITVCCLP